MGLMYHRNCGWGDSQGLKKDKWKDEEEGGGGGRGETEWEGGRVTFPSLAVRRGQVGGVQHS